MSECFKDYEDSYPESDKILCNRIGVNIEVKKHILLVGGNLIWGKKKSIGKCVWRSNSSRN